MRRLQTCRDRRAGVATSVENMSPVMMFRLVQEGLNSRLDEAPRAGIEGFLLTPDDLLGVGVRVQVLLQLSPGEGIELFDADEGGVLDLVGGTVLVKGAVDLTCAEDDAVDFGGFVDGFAVFGLGNDPLEVRLAGELLNRRAGERVTEEGLGEEEDES